MTRQRVLWIAPLLTLLAVILIVAFSFSGSTPNETAENERIESLVQDGCSKCHAFPPPDSLPRRLWPDIVRGMIQIAGTDHPSLLKAKPEQIARWFVERSPETLSSSGEKLVASPLRFEQREVHFDNDRSYLPGTSNVRWIDQGQLLVCDMRNGLVFTRKLTNPVGQRLIARPPNPARAEPVDLDADGLQDLLVADLGSELPEDHRTGSVVWLRNTGSEYDYLPLLEQTGRVSDVRAADLDGDGDTDLVVAEFGWRKSGRVLLLENIAEPGEFPQFEPSVIDSRHGAIHVLVHDFNLDARMDFVTLFAQEFEALELFENLGRLRFAPRSVYAAPHPAWGFSGAELVDLDSDGDLDLLTTNGDSLDDFELKPYHGIQWFENHLGWFTQHDLLKLNGAHRAEAADLDGDGDLDVVACCLLHPGTVRTTRPDAPLYSLVVLLQEGRGIFQARYLEAGNPIHATLDVGDYDSDGDIDVAVGNSYQVGQQQTGKRSWATIWENQTIP